MASERERPRLSIQPPMSSSIPFESQSRAGLSLKRRSLLAPSESMESEGSLAPFEGPEPKTEAALQVAWDKLYRARAILQAEQAHLRDDRISLQGELEALGAREQAVAARELRLEQLERQLFLELEEIKDARESESAITRLTRAPFDMARSVFGAKK